MLKRNFSQYRVVILGNFEVTLLLLLLFSLRSTWRCVDLFVILTLELRFFSIHDGCLRSCSATSTSSLLATISTRFTIAAPPTTSSASATSEASLFLFGLLFFNFLFTFFNSSRFQLLNLLRQLTLAIWLVPFIPDVDFIYFFVQVLNWYGGTDLNHAKLLNDAHIKVKNIFVFNFLLFFPLLLFTPANSSELTYFVPVAGLHEFPIIQLFLHKLFSVLNQKLLLSETCLLISISLQPSLLLEVVAVRN